VTAQTFYTAKAARSQLGRLHLDDVVASDADEDRRQIAEAAEVARQADVIVLALGGNEQTSREAWSLNHMGDCTTLDLLGRQEELVKAMLDTGKPTIVFPSRQTTIDQLLEREVPVIFECWYLGQETGHAVADVLFRRLQPGGNANNDSPLCWSSPGFLQFQALSAARLLFDDVSPLYPFGDGLSYTTFQISNLRLTHKKMKRGVQHSSSGNQEHRQTCW
jgi:beta-glucosidase